MIPRKIQAPGVEFNEIDVSQYNGIDLTENTVFLLNGFADKGEDRVTKIVTSIVDFTNTYGYPTTEAERYLYNGAKQTLINGGIPAVTKIPYQNRSLSTYSCCRYNFGEVHRLSVISEIPDVNNLFPSFLEIGIDYNLSSLYDILENIRRIMNIYSEYEQNESMEAFSEIIDKLDEIDEQLHITGYELTSSWEVVENLNTLNRMFFGIDSLSNLNSSEQVRLFERFMNGICNFESYHLEPNILSRIKSLLFGTIYCFINMKYILTIGENGELSDASYDDPNKIIYDVMLKNGYENYQTFYDSFIKTISKDEFLKCIDDARGTILSVDSEVETLIRSIKYSDIANVSGMKTYVNISADTSEESRFIDFDTYDDYLVGNKMITSDNITIVDITRGKYEKDILVQNEELSSKEYIGIVPVLMAAPNALWFQNLIDHTSDEFSCYNIVSEILATTNKVPQEHVEIPISAYSENGESLGEIAVSYFPKIDYQTPTQLDNTMFQKIGVVVFKMEIDTANGNMINLRPVEAFVGSISRKSKDLTSNTTDFLEDIVNNQSQFINLFINIKTGNERKYLDASTFMIENQPTFSLGFSSNDCEKNISIELMKKSIQLAFDHLQSPNTLKIDVIPDCGMSNIAQYIANTTIDNVGKFDIADSYNFQIKNRSSIKEWKSIIDLYDDFCSNVRKDCMFVADSPRNFCLMGNQKIVRQSNPDNTIENSILPSLKFMVDFNTSYGAGYCNWFRCIDDTTRAFMWMPPTVKVIEAYLVTDNQYNFWDAPAGSRRGVMRDTFDVAFNPSEKDAEKIYINRWNYAVAFPLEGILLEGQKTFQKNQTAFDRVNVRRLFLGIEKDICRMARTFLYEPLTERNMSKFRDMIATYLQNIQTKGGIREFYIICDERNNTPETIDNNELHCSIGIMPEKTLEFIILNFICTNQSANVEEVTSQYI